MKAEDFDSISGGNGRGTNARQLSPGKHTYRFIVDGDRRHDPECRERVANPLGGQDLGREAA